MTGVIVSEGVLPTLRDGQIETFENGYRATCALHGLPYVDPVWEVDTSDGRRVARVLSTGRIVWLPGSDEGNDGERSALEEAVSVLKAKRFVRR